MTPAETDFFIPNFHFNSGATLPELRLHATTLGQPQTDHHGRTINAILIMHGTGGSGQAFLREQFADVLFGEGQLLDANKYFIILPDGIGHGRSSKPSDGLRANFPKYGYHDMVTAQYRLVTEHFGVNHLRLVMGTSMGGMQTWLWGERYPDFMNALMPLASLPAPISGRNRMIRRMILDSIRNSPDYNNGDYANQPCGLINAIHALLFMVSSPLQWQQEAPTLAAADAFFDRKVAEYAATFDANNMLYQFAASEDYNPAADLEKITAPLLALNSADDQVNPPELGIMEQAIRRVKHGRYILLPITAETRGHGTHSLPAIWQHYLARLLAVSEL